MADIIVDTYKLDQYAQRLSSVNSRINRLDHRLDSLYTKVGLLGLFNLIQADVLTGYSWRILRCQSYLNQSAALFEKTENKLLSQDPTNFSKPPITGAIEFIYDVGVGIKTSANKVRCFAKTAIVFVFENPEKSIQYGKVALKAAKGIVKVVKGVSGVVLTGGLYSPVAVLEIISGANDICNALIDGAYIYTDQYDKVGKTDWLKDKMVQGGEAIGSYFGSENAGRLLGSIVYYGVDLVTTLDSLNLSMDKIKQLSSTNLGKLGTELKELANLDVSHIFTTDIEMLRYHAKLAGYTFSETTNLITNLGVMYGVAKEGIRIGKGLDGIVSTTLRWDNWKNPVIKTADSITGFIDKVGKTAKGIKKANDINFIKIG